MGEEEGQMKTECWSWGCHLPGGAQRSPRMTSDCLIPANRSVLQKKSFRSHSLFQYIILSFPSPIGFYDLPLFLFPFIASDWSAIIQWAWSKKLRVSTKCSGQRAILRAGSSGFNFPTSLRHAICFQTNLLHSAVVRIKLRSGRLKHRILRVSLEKGQGKNVTGSPTLPLHYLCIKIAVASHQFLTPKAEIKSISGPLAKAFCYFMFLTLSYYLPLPSPFPFATAVIDTTGAEQMDALSIHFSGLLYENDQCSDDYC